MTLLFWANCSAAVSGTAIKIEMAARTRFKVILILFHTTIKKINKTFIGVSTNLNAWKNHVNSTIVATIRSRPNQGEKPNDKIIIKVYLITKILYKW